MRVDFAAAGAGLGAFFAAGFGAVGDEADFALAALLLVAGAFAAGFGLPAAAFDCVGFVAAGADSEAWPFAGCSTAGGETGFVFAGAVFGPAADGLVEAALVFAAAVAADGFAAVFAFGPADFGEAFATAFGAASVAAFAVVLGEASFEMALAAVLAEVVFSAVAFSGPGLAAFASAALALAEAGFAVDAFTGLALPLVAAFGVFSLVVDPPSGFFANLPSLFVVAAVALPPGRGGSRTPSRSGTLYCLSCRLRKPPAGKGVLLAKPRMVGEESQLLL